MAGVNAIAILLEQRREAADKVLAIYKQSSDDK